MRKNLRHILSLSEQMLLAATRSDVLLLESEILFLKVELKYTLECDKSHR